jgi:hypothetical protein
MPAPPRQLPTPNRRGSRPPDRRAFWAWTIDAILVAVYPLLVAAALWPNAWAFLGLAAISYLAEMRTTGYVVRALSQVSAGQPLRFVIRQTALLLLLVRLGWADTPWFVGFAGGLLALHLHRAVHSGLALYVVRRRRLPVVTRGIDLAELAIPDAPPRFVAGRHTRTLLHLDVFPVAGGAAWALAGGPAWLGAAGLAVSLGLGAALTAVVARHVLRVRHLGDGSRAVKVVKRQIRKLKPEVVLYFSGSLDMAYQVNMWLSTLDRLDRRGLVVLRERGMVDRLGPTKSPVVCIPGPADVMSLDLSTVRVAFYPSNAAKNLHLLRLPGIEHVFLNHGDSDKEASFNPFSKVYDEVWVAGPAGRDRYLEAGVGVRNEEIVEVGRPQLTGVAVGGGTPDPIFTVLYAPTWEGLSDTAFHSSVPEMGPAMVRMLLDHAPALRLLYKPHPLTGTRVPEILRAHHEIVAMIEQANAERAASDGFPAIDDEAAADAERRLAELTRRLAALGGTGGVAAARPGDEAQTSRDAGRPDPARWAARQDCAEAWNEAYWAAGGWWRHRVIDGADPHLYDCFNRCDLLITDISSVASDFIASDKPFAVTNVDGLGDERFREQFPTAATAAYVINPGCAELPELLAEVSGDGPDRMAPDRRAHKIYLLGSDQPDSFAPFAGAVDRLADGEPVAPDHDGKGPMITTGKGRGGG